MYKIGDYIKSRPNIIIEGTDISNWHGKILELPDDESDHYLIAWDSITIKNMPEPYILSTLLMTDIESFHHFYLGKTDFDLSEKRDDEKDIEDALGYIYTHYYWKALNAEQPKEVLDILRNYELGDDDWADLLEKNLNFPFQANLTESHRGPLSQVEIAKVTGVEIEDGHYGVIASIKVERATYAYPFCDLEAVDTNTKNAFWIKAYAIYFANHL